MSKLYTTDGKVRWFANEEDVNTKLISILGEKFETYRKKWDQVKISEFKSQEEAKKHGEFILVMSFNDQKTTFEVTFEDCFTFNSFNPIFFLKKPRFSIQQSMRFKERIIN